MIGFSCIVFFFYWFCYFSLKYIHNINSNIYFAECSDGDCAEHCNTCNSTLCEPFEGNCTDGYIEGYTGHQCLAPGLYNIPYISILYQAKIVLFSVLIIKTIV